MSSWRANVRFAFIVPQNAQIADVVLFSECLQIANRQLDMMMFEHHVIQLADISARHRNEETGSKPCETARRFDACVVFGTNSSPSECPAEMMNWLRNQSRHGALIGSIGNGAYTLARCGLFQGRRVALPIHAIHAFQENFPNIGIAHDAVVADDHCFSCAGGVTAIDVALQLIADHQGFELAGCVADRLSYDIKARRTRHAESLIEHEIGRADRPTHIAIKLMRENIEVPISIRSIAKQSGVSIRQLQRKFAYLFSTTPARYYTKIRLVRARSLLQDTNLSVMEISQATGFGSHAAFSNKYRQAYGKSPSSERKLVGKIEPPSFTGSTDLIGKVAEIPEMVL